MSLKLFYDTPFLSAFAVDLIDVFTGTGVDQTFPTTNKAYTRVGSTVEYDGTELNKYDGGFTVNNNNTITTSTTPPLSAEGIIPGMNNVPVGVLYDNDNVPGLLTPRVIETPFWLADPDNIASNTYSGIPGSLGIALSVVNLIAGAVPQVSWCQLACSQADTQGSAFTYLVSGEVLYTNGFSVFGLINASSVATSISLFVDSASDFPLGDYIKIADNTSTQEIVRVLGYTAPYTLTLDLTNYSHYPGETVYNCGRKFWLQTTVPANAVNNTASSFYNLAIRKNYTIESRL